MSLDPASPNSGYAVASAGCWKEKDPRINSGAKLKDGTPRINLGANQTDDVV